MTNGLAILMKKPSTRDPNPFSFLSPFSLSTWVCILAAYLAVSFLLALVTRLVTFDNIGFIKWRIDNDIWFKSWWRWAIQFCLRSLVQSCIFVWSRSWETSQARQVRLSNDFQSFALRSISARMVTLSWWMFILLMVSSYTANLAAFLTVNRMENKIKSAENLANQEEIKYGTYKGGSTIAFFEVNIS